MAPAGSVAHARPCSATGTLPVGETSLVPAGFEARTRQSSALRVCWLDHVAAFTNTSKSKGYDGCMNDKSSMHVRRR